MGKGDLALPSGNGSEKVVDGNDGLMTYWNVFRVVLCALPIPPIVCVVASQVRSGFGITNGFMLLLGLLVLMNVAWVLLLRIAWPATTEIVNEMADEQDRFVDSLPASRVAVMVFLSSATLLLVELVLIRWHGCVFEFFSLYKNVTLISCFAGFGLGFALSRGRSLPLFFTYLLILVQTVYLLSLRYGLPPWRVVPFLMNPVKEHLAMGVRMAEGTLTWSAVYSFLCVVVVLSALTCMPMGVACGRLMQRMAPLRSYGWNLLGSLCGIILCFVLGWLWTSPVVWFMLACAMLLLIQPRGGLGLKASALCSLLIGLTLAYPIRPGREQLYSPYQYIERGPSQDSFQAGLTTLRVSGNYFQRILNLSVDAQDADDAVRAHGIYYEFPYRLHDQAKSAVIVGAGTGNDIAAALRCGLESVDAVEIDPVIARMGKMYHPEKPYQDPRVTLHVNDARTFLRTSGKQYDLIVYGLLDSHSLLSHGSSVRLDSFVYTVEAFREARARLAPGGCISLSFCVLSDALGRKIFLMLKEAFDGLDPVCVSAEYDGSIVFIQSDHDLSSSIKEARLGAGFDEVTERFSNETIAADVSTDDWPFFYMPKRVLPISYIALLCTLLLVLGLLTRRFVGVSALFSCPSLFFMGAGFMLIQTKGITELGLMFGNTWQVVGFVIAGLLIMAYLANLLVQAGLSKNHHISFALLLVSIVAGLVLRAYLPESGWGGAVGLLILLVIPMLFSGLAFSSVLRSFGDVSAAMASNLMGAILGGVLEYFSMWKGFSSLYWVAFALYGIAWITAGRMRCSRRTG